MLLCRCYDYASFKVSWIWLLIWLLRNTARAARQQTAYSMVSISVTGIWKERERGFGRERNVKSLRRRREEFQHSPGGFLWSKNNSLLVGISLTPSHTFLLHKNPFPFPLKCLPHRLSDVIQSVYPFAVFNIHQAICIVWWLELKYKLLDRWTTFDIGEPRLRKWWRGKEI